jgi:D-3-phosphoglycerate dehydrogenase / 2-oxoglutarate reductase
VRPRILNVEPRRYDEDLRGLLATAGEVDYVQCSCQDDFGRALATAPYSAAVVRLGLAVDAAAMNAAPNLRWLVTPTTGLDHIDLDEAARRGIEVISLHRETEFLASIRSTAEHTWSLLLAVVRNLPRALDDVRQGHWRREPFLAGELDGKTLGVIGYGRLGRIVARYGMAFFMRVIATDTDPRALVGAPTGVEPVDLDTLLASSDVVSLHIPLVAGTRGFLSAARIQQMKRGAVLVNTSRGELVDEMALLAALRGGHLAGAALDVLAGDSQWNEDGLPPDHALVEYARAAGNLLITPHMGGYGATALRRTREHVTRLLLRRISMQKEA